MGNSQALQSVSSWFSSGVAKIRSRGLEYSTTPSRIISRSGRVKIRLDQISLGKRQRYWKNPLTTLLDLKWRWIFLIFVLGFLTTWFIFAVVYYSIASYHGDIGTDLEVGHTRCLINVGSFTAAFLFSVESQQTIGYGYRSPSSECSAAIFTVFIQFIFGLAVQCIIAGLVVAKLQMGSRSPKAILFSQKACIGKCKGQVCLMVRVGNSGKSELVGARGFGVIVERQKTQTGEKLTETYLEFLTENGSSNINLLWPAVIHCAIMDDTASFITKLRKHTAELIVTIEGTMCSTGQTLQLRTSYIASEIDVGKQFVDLSPRLVLNDGGKMGFYHEVDYTDFDVTEADENWDTKLWSGKVE